MKAILRTIGMTAALALGLVLLVHFAQAQDAKSPPSPKELLKVMEEAGKPGSEHLKLQPLVGDWTLSVKLWTDPSQPPAEAHGTVERKWIMGGRFVQENARLECGGKSFEGMGLFGYDRAEKKFSIVRACGLCGALTQGLASCGESGKKFECAREECCPITGKRSKGRDEIVIESNDRIVVNVFKTFDNKEVKVMEIVSSRKK